MTKKCVPILQIEDDPVDVRALRRVCSKFEKPVSITVANDGFHALEILRQPKDNDDPSPPPYLIFLDLNMPRMNGFEFLEVVKEDDSLDENTVCILTSSKLDEGRFDQFDQLVDDYLVKSEIDEDHSRLENVVCRFLERNAS